MTDPKLLERDAITFANQAVTFDQQGQISDAIFYYSEAAQALINAHQSGSQASGLLDKAREYIQRSEFLKTSAKSGANDANSTGKSSEQMDKERAGYLLQQAFQEDEANNTQEAFELYGQAAELYINLSSKSVEKELVTKLRNLAVQALDRAEVLKKELKGEPDVEINFPGIPSHSPKAGRKLVGAGDDKRHPGPLGFSLQDDSHTADSAHQSSVAQGGGKGGGGGAGGYTKQELQVLRTTSYINGRQYVPFMQSDIGERFAFPVPFTDKEGFLALSPKQKSKFGKWIRPDAFCDNPQMIYAVSSFSIKQTIVSDCSFVASLAISAQYERRFQKKLITSVIYPQNRKGEPQYNPCGKYMVKLYINGVHRKVIIDDYLPMSKDGQLLCSYSNNKNELWVSLLEKAYMKVMGGYDFPGSNSNIDLHALTGWIPERVSMSSKNSDEFNADNQFKMIFDRFHKGHCLVTMATGEMSDNEADRAGLVPTHAYAMLDIQQIQGYRLFQLKNPWSHLRWRGNFSEKDVSHWTESMKKALNYDPNTAAMFDNGIFWIDYESLQKFFDVIYINWNPELFPHTTCYHQTWEAKEGPKKDSYNIGDNPQYRLEVRASKQSAVWVQLTRHITDKDDFANNREFITLLVYKTNGTRVYYPFDPPPYKDGIRINSPHYLCKMVAEPGTSLYSLVISQYEKNNTLHYTLRVYSTTEFKLNKISEPYDPKYEKQITGEWKGKSAGGCGNYPDTTNNNPIYQLKIDNKSTDNQILVELRGPKDFSVGFEITSISNYAPSSAGSFTKKSSGDFRRGFSVLELSGIPGGIYNIKPCTFLPKQEAPFFLNISSSVPISVSKIS